MRGLLTVLLASIFCMLCLSGCASHSGHQTVSKRSQRLYSERDLSLNLVQDEQSDDLILTLKNQSAEAITDAFPEGIFEGTLWILQEGEVPLQVYPAKYFTLRIKSFGPNPETTLPPGAAIPYRIPMESLVCPLSQRKPDGIQPVLAYAFMDGTKAVSNVIPLKGQEKIVWQPTLSRLTGAK